MKVYFDNVIVSGMARGDLQPPAELVAVRAIYACAEVEVITSRHSWREQERTQDPKIKEILLDAQGNVPTVQNDHEVLGFTVSQDGVGGMVTIPLVSDVIDQELYDALLARGAKEDDAFHLMYAICNECDRFVTLDTKDLLPIRAKIEPACRGMRIVTSTELATELGL